MIIGSLKRKLPVRKIKKYKNWREVQASVIQNKTPQKVVCRNGLVFNAPKNSTVLEIIDEIIFKKDYNPNGFELKNDYTVVDIGANIGVFSVYAASVAKKVIAVEPFPDNVKYIEKNTLGNKLKNINIIEAAVSNRVGTTKLYVSDISAGHLIFEKNIGGKLNKSISVKTTTLTRIMKNESIDRIDFLKIDCEGAEGNIISNLTSAELKKIGMIAMEFHDNVSSLNHKQIKRILEKNNFEVRCIEHGNSPFGYLYAKNNQ